MIFLTHEPCGSNRSRYSCTLFVQTKNTLYETFVGLGYGSGSEEEESEAEEDQEADSDDDLEQRIKQKREAFEKKIQEQGIYDEDELGML